MQYITKLKLAAVHQICNLEDKSTEFMIEFMQEMCEVQLDCVMSYLQLDSKEHEKLFKEVESMLIIFDKIDNSIIYK